MRTSWQSSSANTPGNSAGASNLPMNLTGRFASRRLSAKCYAAGTMHPSGFNVLTFRNLVPATVAATSSPVASLVVEVFAIKPRLSCALFVLWLAGGAAATAQAPGLARPVFTRQAITAALSHVTATVAASQDPRSDWSRLRQLTKIDIVLFAQGLAGRNCRIVAVEDAALTVVDLDSPNGTTLRIPRTDVNEIRQWTGRRGSPLGAVIGAAGGFALGYV